MTVTLKLSRPVFGFLIVVVNAAMVLVDSVANLAYPNSPYTAPVIIFIDAVANAGIVLLTTEQAATPS